MKLFRQIYRALLPLVVPGVFAAGCAVPEPTTAEVPPPPIDLVWSPSGKQAVFAAVPDASPEPDCPTELYELDLKAVTLLRLIQAQPDASDPESDLSCFYDPKYSADGLQIYFITPAWATSGAIQAYDRTTGKVAFITDGCLLYGGNIQTSWTMAHMKRSIWSTLCRGRLFPGPPIWKKSCAPHTGSTR